MKSIHGAESDKVIHVKSRMASPVILEDGTHDVILEEFEEDIPDLGREELICNSCGWPSYPECKNTFCKAWVHYTMDDLKKHRELR